MKAFTIIAKIVAAIAAIAGAIYLAATYGDKIVAWAKKMLGNCPCKDGECVCEESDVAEEAAEEEVTEEAPIEDAPVEEVVIEEGEPVAEEADFEA